EFNLDRMPYDRIVRALDIEINRYARLIESLRRLPPELRDLEVVPDSLAYHNDTLDLHLQHTESLLQKALEEEVKALDDTTESRPPFILDEAGQADRDSCLFYAAELLKMYADNKAIAVADSLHYREAQLRLKESYDYAKDYYAVLQRNVFIDGQTPWSVVVTHLGTYWKQAKDAMKDKYDIDYFQSIDGSSDDDDVLEEVDEKAMLENGELSYLMAFVNLILLFLFFMILWGLAALLLWPVFRLVRPVRNAVAKQQRPYVTLLVACLLFLLIGGGADDDGIIGTAANLASTFIWLLMAIITALLLRLKPERLKNGIANYRPTIYAAIFVISCRILFLPNALMNIIFPPFLVLITLWQLLVCFTHGRKADRADFIIGWISFGITFVAMAFSVAGYIFLALLILVWWYFQLAAVLTLTACWHFLVWYKASKLDSRIAAYRDSITYVTGPDRERLLFGASWFYELLRNVAIPVMAFMSFALCFKMSLNVFDFDEIFDTVFYHPFLLLSGKDGADSFRISLYSVFLLTCLVFVFNYISKALHVIWQQVRYESFMLKHNKTTIRNNEINLSLGNSIISVAVWFTYLVIVVIKLQIPTGSLGLIAGGLSAGIGIALKDIINNFIYGIQLMGGRLRVGDWIECDGVRGRVTDINYQSTLVVTENATQVAFLNASLFSKNFTNLTRNNSYEFTKLVVGVEYGTDVQRVREVLESAMEVMKTKDKYGRDVVDPAYGIYVRFSDFGDSSVNIAVKQYVLVAERIAYVDKAKEVIYTALNKAGITIPFPQCDVHMKDD
ncbi:MAG: mechanosensitive ion channel, partial [Bacteroidales bacterium]|nr:mechanosensitive ion channel [Bacteroidales bacterium]